MSEADEVVLSITGIASERGYVVPVAAHRGRLVFGMALDFSEAAGYYGLYTAMSCSPPTCGPVV